MAKNIFSEVEKQSDAAGASRASWRGVLALNIPTLGLGAVEYHLRAAKAHGDLKPVNFVKLDKKTGKEVVSREVPRMYRYKEGPTGERIDVEEITPEEAKKKVRFDGKWLVSVRTEKRYFLKHELEMSGQWIEVPAERIIDKQDGEEIEPFERTTRVEVDKDGFVPIERLEEYKFKEVYQLAPDTDKKVKETVGRIRQLARYLMEKQTALVAFFSWGRGYQFYTAVIYPYERKDGKLWLLMGMSEGILKLDTTWALEGEAEAEGLPPVPTAKKKPKVVISK
ncbi:MAG TPA: Ku protein [Nitrososphaerales archaeon]|nr:Ku protein [Nitrososphaerales archaeon]HUK75631.1 Ku protein [Nitrososphaerales archaeon]